ncbi:MAG TPA: hypothetical protein VE870_03430 [Bacteroidales bacterium]|nr:hypothetical protein [Bacteroidales bacterium]
MEKHSKPIFCCLFILSSLLFFIPSVLNAQIKTLSNGDKISFDGEYYDFRDSAGIQMIKMWIPPGVHPVKGVFISGHGGGGGDSRDFARDENMRAFAMRLGFAVAGLHNFPGRRAYEQGAPVFFHVMDEFAKLGNHPELANLPFVMYGSSNGGATTYGFVNYAPERAICFVTNVSAGGRPEIPVDEALKVPGIFIVGKFDALMRQRGIDRAREIVTEARKRNARWAWAMELKGHQDGSSFDVYMKLVEQSVKARYPENGNPSKGPVNLKDIPVEAGWLVDPASWDSGLTYVDAYNTYKGDRQAAGWVLNKDMAYVYRSMATHHNPVSVKVREFDRTFNPHTDPGTMFSLGGPVARPGEHITIVCDTVDFAGWQKIKFFNGASLLGEVTQGNKPQIATTLDQVNQVYCLTIAATGPSGEQRTCEPMHFFVKDPDLSWKANLPKPVFNGLKTNAGSKNAGKEISCTSPNPEDSILVAYGLNADQEKEYSSTDNKIASFWKLIDDSKDYIIETARSNATSGSSFNFVLTNDCAMKVKAAYGADGVYLLFLITDDNDVAWPNKFTGTENEQFYLDFDAVDALMDSRSVKQIGAPENRDMLVDRAFGMTFTTRQYQVACGTEKERPLGFRRSLAKPWDFNATYHSFEDAREEFGVKIENVKLDYYLKAQEWFIPWSEFGGGFKGEPDAGTRMGFSAGFNDRDAGEHFPPGVTSSGGTLKASNAIRWIDRKDPWASNKPPYAWGEIELGRMLE